MTNYVLIATSVSSSNGFSPVTMTDDEVLEIAPNVSATATGNVAAIYYDSNAPSTDDSVDIEGYATGLYAVSATYQSGTFNVNVGAHGEAIGQSAGIEVVASSVDSSPQTISNAGVIYGSVTGLTLLDNDVQISNSGSIGGKTAIYLTYSSATGKNDFIDNAASGVISGQIAIDGAGSGFALINDGTISATGSVHVVNASGGPASVTSSGRITGVTKALDFGAGDDKVFNSGSISVSGQFAIAVAGGGFYLNNSGHISAALHTIGVTAAGSASQIVNQTGGIISASGLDDAINDTLGAAGIVNHGEIDGSAILGAGSSLVNSGKFVGQADFVGANATLRNSGDMSYGGKDYVIRLGGVGSDDVVQNSATGVIDGVGTYALYDGAGTLSFVNLGEVDGLVASNALTTLTNVGTIDGTVVLSGNNSTVINHGEIIGSIEFSGTGNIYRGQLGEVIGTIHGAGADGRYTGGAGDDVFDMTASGAAYVSGGAGDDGFLFTASGLTAATTLLGGDGQDTLVFSTAGVIASSAFAHVTGVETVDLAAGANTLALNNAMITAANGGAVTVNGNALRDVIDASAVVNAADTVTIYGGGGADTFTAGGAKDVFVYDSRLDSTGSVYDIINGANLGVDRFDVSAAAGSILAVNAAVTTGSLSTSTFNADLAADLPAAKLGAHDAVLFTANAGTLSGQTFLVVDVNGAAGYQANADLVIRLAGATGTLTTANFV